ncbi:MAG: hypothetical protein Q8761_02965, partial [Sweet potato little leaf phytoplasma]|nr:hypothetical protein [Sweet potato little leaf phytoplasma]
CAILGHMFSIFNHFQGGKAREWKFDEHERERGKHTTKLVGFPAHPTADSSNPYDDLSRSYDWRRSSMGSGEI